MLRIAGILSVLVMGAWFLLVWSVDRGPTADALTVGFLTLYAIVALVLIWLSVALIRLVRAALKARKEVFGSGNGLGSQRTKS